MNPPSVGGRSVLVGAMFSATALEVALDGGGIPMGWLTLCSGRGRDSLT